MEKKERKNGMFHEKEESKGAADRDAKRTSQTR